TFAPGVTTQTISVPIVGDATYEHDETFSVRLSSPQNASIARSEERRAGKKIKDDPAPTLEMRSNQRPEGNTGTANLVFTVTLTGPTEVPVTVDFTTADGSATVADDDYRATAGTLTFAPGVTTQTISVPIVGDATYEHDETFSVRLSSPQNASIA